MLFLTRRDRPPPELDATKDRSTLALAADPPSLIERAIAL